VRGDDGAMSELRTPRLWQALVPVALLIVLLGVSVALFGEDASYGANQIALLVCAGVAAALGMRNGLSWSAVQEAIVRGIAISTGALLILLMVGAVIGSWILSGTVPTLIDYGLALMHPSVFLPTSALLCAVAGMAIGSSWTVAGTLGVALMGVATGLGVNPAAAAGAVISGAYFGDKLSPLSDTTNLAPAAAGSELFAHIRFMGQTTLPAFALALLGFAVLGWGADPDGAADTAAFRSTLAAQYAMGPHLLLPLLLVFVLAARRVPALPTLAAGTVLGLVMALLFQPARVLENAGIDGATWQQMTAGAWRALFDGVSAESGNAEVDELLNRGGMASMLNTVWLILCAMTFGACMEAAGLLQQLVVSLLTGIRRAGTMVAVTVLTAFGINVLASDQYIAIVLTGRLYRLEFERLGLDPLNLSRAVEDGGTLTSALVPWNTCGAYMAATLGVATFSYLPYALFNWLSPLIAIGLALLGLRLLKQRPA
jgi:Na+:H+ antiporter, NhaC family